MYRAAEVPDCTDSCACARPTGHKTDEEAALDDLVRNPTALVCEADAELRRRIVAALPTFTCSEMNALDAPAVHSAGVDVVVAGMHDTVPEVLARVAELADLAPGLLVLVVHTDPSRVFQLGAIAVGAQDVLTPADLEGGRLERSALSALYRSRFREAVALRGRQDEFASLERWSQEPSNTQVSTKLFGVGPLSRTEPELFTGLAERYAETVVQSLKAEAYAGHEEQSGTLRRMARELGRLGAGPRDVIALHTVGMRTRLEGAQDGVAAHAYVQEARYVLVQLMGYLVSFYRAQALGTAAGGGGER